MRIFALELNNQLKGISQRKNYIEALLAALPNPELVLLPEMAICSYMASQDAWAYADENGKDTRAWAMQMAEKYHTYLGVGYLDFENGDYFNRYLLADAHQIYGVVTKSEGEAAVFKRGWFDNTIQTPFGTVAVAICYDSKRRHFYETIKEKEISLMVFPHGCPADPKKQEQEIAANDFFCNVYASAYHVPVVYVNSVGALEYMPGKMGALMRKAGFRMNGKSKIYTEDGTSLPCGSKEAIGMEVRVAQHGREKDIVFYGEDLVKGNFLFRQFILKPDVKAGIRCYNESKRSKYSRST